MSTPVPATKLYAPTPRTQVVSRPRLIDHLDSTLDPGHRLTLVSAPAGFGKTTLLVDWLGTVDEAPTSVGWISLDGGDNDLASFLSLFVTALQGMDLVDDGFLASLDSTSPTAAMAAIVNSASVVSDLDTDAHWIVVLDDYHAIEGADVHEALTFLLDHLPPRLHVVVATRADPPFPLARLRSRGQLTEVRAADLRFTQDEALDFLNRVMGLDLTPEDVESLDQRTEGWAAGLQLAALSLQGLPERGDVVGFIEAFTGSSRFVIDYLADEVLARQTDETRVFLLETAVLDRLTGPLCDAVTGRTDGTRMLEELERGNLFLVPLDGQRTWFRYHHMFADVLRARLLADHPEKVPALHRRASDWFSAQGPAVDAVRHALAAEDVDRAARLIEEALPEMRRARQDSVLLGWIRSLPEDVVTRNPVLSIVSGWSWLMAGDLDAVESKLDDAEAALAAGADDPSLAATWVDTEDLRTAPAMISVYRASVAQARGDVDGTVHHARHALSQAGPDDHFIRGAGSGYLGLAAWAAGDVQEAITTFSDAVGSLEAAGNTVDALDATIVLADLARASGRPSRARSTLERALTSATAESEPYPRATADLHVGLAELDRERGDHEDAEAHLQTARTLADSASITENRYRWFVAMARMQADRGDVDAASDLLDEAEAMYRHGFYPDVGPIPALRARIQIAAGDVASAEVWAAERDIASADVTFLHEYEHLTLVRLLLAQDRLDDPGALLDRLHAAADPGRHGSLIEIGMLRALTLHRSGDVAQALEVLHQTLSNAPEPDGYVRLFLDEGAPMRAFLGDAMQHDGLRPHAERLLGVGDVPAPSPGALPDPLSSRELDVLRLLDSELTGPEISHQLFVSLNTLRTHTKRIFTKLDVNSRAAAVRRAREIGLL